MPTRCGCPTAARWCSRRPATAAGSTCGGSRSADGQPGELTRLTHGPGHEVTPAVAPDGTVIYAAVTPDAERREIETHLEERAPDGAIRALTAGPADSSPAVSPDGARLAFARPAVHGGKPDSELWLMVRATGAIAPLVDLPLTDESGPVWSRDGRFVFATSVLRGARRPRGVLVDHPRRHPRGRRRWRGSWRIGSARSCG